MSDATDFQEIGHSGGVITISISTSYGGGRGYQFQFRHVRPNAAAIFPVWAIPQGVAVATAPTPGLGEPAPVPPIPGCYQVFISSDSTGMFGHECPSCRGYWRAKGGARYCPYCAAQADRHEFLTASQKRFVKEFCNRLNNALDQNDGTYTIDLDAVADAVGKSGPKPPFYSSEMSQQTKFECDACGASADILGKFCYCPSCATRNEAQLVSREIRRLHDDIEAASNYEESVKSAVSLFDATLAQLMLQLLNNVPLTPERRNKIEKRSLHDLNKISQDLELVFGIRLFHKLEESDAKFVRQMFHRRHVYEHNGGEVDQRYLDDSGDDTVKLKQLLRETKPTAHQMLVLVEKMLKNVTGGFHEILVPDRDPIEQHTTRKKWRANQQP